MNFPNPSHFTKDDGLQNRWYFAQEQRQMMERKQQLDDAGNYTDITLDARSDQYCLIWCQPKKEIQDAIKAS